MKVDWTWEEGGPRQIHTGTALPITPSVSIKMLTPLINHEAVALHFHSDMQGASLPYLPSPNANSLRRVLWINWAGPLQEGCFLLAAPHKRPLQNCHHHTHGKMHWWPIPPPIGATHMKQGCHRTYTLQEKLAQTPKKQKQRITVLRITALLVHVLSCHA